MTAVIAEAEKNARAKDIEVTVECSLYEFYNGALKEVTYQQTICYEGSDETEEVDKTIMVQVKPGFGEQTTLRFPKFGNKSFGAHASDLIVRFVSKDPTGGFTRDGNDLVYCVNVDLIEALESKPATIKTLDGRSILVTPNEAITPQIKVVLKGEGMPAQPIGNVLADTLSELKGADAPRGNLVVRYNIAFPKKILNHHKDSIMQALAQC